MSADGGGSSPLRNLCRSDAHNAHGMHDGRSELKTLPDGRRVLELGPGQNTGLLIRGTPVPPFAKNDHGRILATGVETFVPRSAYDPRVFAMPAEPGGHMFLDVYLRLLFQAWEYISVVDVSYFPSRPRPRFCPKRLCQLEKVYYVRADADDTQGVPFLPQAVPHALLSPRCEHHRPCLYRVRGSDNYKHFNVRIYLGSMDGPTGTRCYSERHDTMHLNQMIELQLDVVALARRVGVALALVHWATELDAGGMRFHMLTEWRRMSPCSAKSRTCTEFGQCDTRLCIEGYRNAKFMSMDEQGVNQAVEEMQLSYCYPRPYQKLEIQQKTWDAFVASYIGASDFILREKHEETRMVLPRLVIHKLLNPEPSEWLG